MTIDFQCQVCGKVLQTSDDKAGRRARCPGCGEPILVPQPGASAEPVRESWEFDEATSAPAATAGQQSGRQAGGGARRPCPMCGESISANASRCDYCGEALRRDRRDSGRRDDGTVIRVDEVLTQAWERFTERMGLAIGSVLLYLAVLFIAAFLSQFVVGFGFFAAMRGGGPGAVFAIPVFMVLFLFAYVLLNMWLQLGLNRLMLNLARAQRTDVGELFTGGPWLGRMVLCGIVLGLIGFAAAIVMGILMAILAAARQPELTMLVAMPLYVFGSLALSLMFWCYPFALIDRNLPGVGALGAAREAMTGNYFSMFMLFLLIAVVNLLGALPLGLGLIFTIPYSLLILATAYDHMSGEPEHEFG